MSECGIERLSFEEVIDNSQMQITSLPNEVFLKIFSHLTTYEILANVSRVCKYFYRLTKDPYLVKTIILKRYDEFDGYYKKEFVYEAIRHSRGLTQFSIQNGQNLDYAEDLISTALKWCPNIVDFSIGTYPGNPLSNDCMTLIGNYVKNLKKLIICGHGIGFASSFGAMQLAKLKNLRHVELLGCTNFASDEIMTLAKNCENLEYLSIRQVCKTLFALMINKVENV